MQEKIYTKRPSEISAVEFDGVINLGSEVAQWVVDLGGMAVWYDKIEPSDDIPVEDQYIRPESVRVQTIAQALPVAAKIGDYIAYFGRSGDIPDFRVMTASEFQTAYKLSD